jgi:hypothetical protein
MLMTVGSLVHPHRFRYQMRDQHQHRQEEEGEGEDHPADHPTTTPEVSSVLLTRSTESAVV